MLQTLQLTCMYEDLLPFPSSRPSIGIVAIVRKPHLFGASYFTSTLVGLDWLYSNSTSSLLKYHCMLPTLSIFIMQKYLLFYQK
jgi:hypothetical protein